jgi:ubiquinone biosynthesis protein COQ9
MASRKTGAKSAARSEDTLRSAVLAAALKQAPFDGFTGKVLERAGKEAGADAKALAKLFPDGAMSLVEAFSESADREMEKRLARAKLSAMKIRERIKTAIAARLDAMRPHKEAARRAAAFLTLPPHAALGLKLLYRTVDSMWRAAGDTSTDFNFYTKRAILAGVYSSTLMRWFTDESADEHQTMEFLGRRIEDVMRFEKFKAKVRESTKGLPSFSEILNGARGK